MAGLAEAGALPGDEVPEPQALTPEEARAEAEARAWTEVMTRAGIPPRFRAAHLGTNCAAFGADPTKAAGLTAARALVADGHVHQRERDRFCLLLSGAYGAGKTWLATAAFKELLWRRRTGLWLKFHRFIREVQASYSAAAEESVEAVLSRYQRTPILLLDDVGDLTRGVETDDRRQLLYEVLDHRNDHLLPTLITTNLSGAQLAEQFGERTLQRVLEMCALVEMGGENLRLAHPTP